VRFCGLVLVTLLLVHSSAAAKVGLQGALTVAGGWDDNPLAQPNSDGGDGFFQLRPSLILTAAGLRTVQRLTYALSANLFIRNAQQLNSLLNSLSYQALFTPLPRLSLILSAGVGEGQLGALSTAQASAVTAAQALPTGNRSFVSATADETLSWEFTARMRGLQTLTFNSFFPFGAPGLASTYSIDNILALERAFAEDIFVGSVRLNYIDFPAVHSTGPPVIDVPERQQLLAAISGAWRHDFTYSWSGELDAGAVIAMRPDGSGRVIEPTALAALRYLRKEGRVELSYARLVTANVYLSQTLVNDEVTLRGSVPFGSKDQVTIGASAAYHHGRVINVDTGVLGASVNMWFADATISYYPRREIELFARYQFTDEIGNPSDVTPLPTFKRHVALVGMTAIYPVDPVANVPTHHALRADRADAIEVPEAHSPLPAAPEKPKY
jgi:hypothetical protein